MFLKETHLVSVKTPVDVFQYIETLKKRLPSYCRVNFRAPHGITEFMHVRTEHVADVANIVYIEFVSQYVFTHHSAPHYVFDSVKNEINRKQTLEFAYKILASPGNLSLVLGDAEIIPHTPDQNGVSHFAVEKFSDSDKTVARAVTSDEFYALTYPKKKIIATYTLEDTV